MMSLSVKLFRTSSLQQRCTRASISDLKHKSVDNFEIGRSFAALIKARIAPETSEIIVEVLRNKVNFCANKKQTIEARAPK